MRTWRLKRTRREIGTGFTLVEMLIVIVVIGIVVGITLPSIDITHYRTESAMQGIGMTLLSAERQAITSQHDIILMFDVANQRIRIHEDANDNGVVDPGERVHGVSLGEGIVFGLGGAPARPMGPGPIVFTKVIGGYPALVFHRDGSASEAGGFYLTSVRAAASGTHTEDSRSIEIDRATGRAEWWKYGAPAWRRAF
jgi:prepilin-type N-terminal cleavage/methylation domain-containing protein